MSKKTPYIALDTIDERSEEHRQNSYSQISPLPGHHKNKPSDRQQLIVEELQPFDKKSHAISEAAMTNKELEIVRAEMAKDAFKLSKKDKIMSWTVLMTLLLAQISNQWQRFLIASAYQYDDGSDDPYYMMKVAIPDFSQSKYGLLSGALFTSLFSVTVLFSGVLSDNCSRRLLLSCAAVLWSVTSITTALSTTYSEIAVSRMMLGFFEAFCGPPAYSLIVDYFPPEVRTTANAVYAFGIYVGNALSSMIIIMIKSLGWRWTYAVTGFVGIGIGVLVLIIVKDPIRGRFEPRVDVAKVEDKLHDQSIDEGDGDFEIEQTQEPPKQPNICVRYLGGFKAMFKNNVCFYVVVAASFRFWQGYTIAYYAQSFFNDYNMVSEYGVLNGLSVMIGGFSSQLIAGQISDRLEGRIPRIKAYVCMTMSLLGIATTCLCFLVTFNFYFSITCLFLTYFLAEGWMSPAVAMIQLTIDVRYKGVAMGVFLFATAIAGTIGTFVVGFVIQDFHIQSQEKKGWIIALNTAVPCLFSALFFYISSIHYGRFKQQLVAEKDEATVKASNYNFSDQQSVFSYGQFKRKDSMTRDVVFVSGRELRVTRREPSASVQPRKRPILMTSSVNLSRDVADGTSKAPTPQETEDPSAQDKRCNTMPKQAKSMPDEQQNLLKGNNNDEFDPYNM